MIRRTSGRLVAMISLREVSGSSRGTMPAAFSSGRVSSKIRPLDRAMVIGDTVLPDQKSDFTAYFAVKALLSEPA